MKPTEKSRTFRLGLPVPRVILLFLCVLPSFVSSAPSEAPRILTHMDLGFLGILGGGMEYSLPDRPLRDEGDLKQLIYAQGDPEACDLIRKSGELHSAAWVFYGAGFATGLDVGLAFQPVRILGVDWFDRVATGLGAAQVFWAAGALFDAGGEGRKFNAVQRYNQVVEEGKEEAWVFDPPALALGPLGSRIRFGVRF